MSSSVIVRLNVDGGPDLEMTAEAARDLWEQLSELFGIGTSYLVHDGEKYRGPELSAALAKSTRKS